MTDRDTGRSEGFGFVEMGSAEAAQAIARLSHTELNGQRLSVTAARARPPRLLVGNLPYEGTAAELTALFSTVGPVCVVSLPVERESGKPRGFAFVEFPDPVHVLEARRHFHTQPFKGRALAVNAARAQESRPPAPSLPRSSRSLTEHARAAPLSAVITRRSSLQRRDGQEERSHHPVSTSSRYKEGVRKS